MSTIVSTFVDNIILSLCQGSTQFATVAPWHNNMVTINHAHLALLLMQSCMHATRARDTMIASQHSYSVCSQQYVAVASREQLCQSRICNLLNNLPLSVLSAGLMLLFSCALVDADGAGDRRRNDPEVIGAPSHSCCHQAVRGKNSLQREHWTFRQKSFGPYISTRSGVCIKISDNIFLFHTSGQHEGGIPFRTHPVRGHIPSCMTRGQGVYRTLRTFDHLTTL